MHVAVMAFSPLYIDCILALNSAPTVSFILPSFLYTIAVDGTILFVNICADTRMTETLER